MVVVVVVVVLIVVAATAAAARIEATSAGGGSIERDERYGTRRSYRIPYLSPRTTDRSNECGRGVDRGSPNKSRNERVPRSGREGAAVVSVMIIKGLIVITITTLLSPCEAVPRRCGEAAAMINININININKIVIIK